MNNFRKVFYATKVSMKCHFLNNFSKTVNLSFNELIDVNSLCSFYLTKEAKIKFQQIHQIYLKAVKLSYHTENGILNSFDPYG